MDSMSYPQNLLGLVQGLSYRTPATGLYTEHMVESFVDDKLLLGLLSHVYIHLTHLTDTFLH